MSDRKIEFRENCIDLIRILAATIVLLSHSLKRFGIYKPAWALFFTDGSIGVIAFNVLSGYLIFSSWERCLKKYDNKKTSIKVYVLNRAIRIYPTLITSCILIIVLSILIKGQEIVINYRTPIKILLYCFTAVSGNPVKGGYDNGVLWTLFNEIILYILIPIFYSLLKKLNKREFILIIIFFWLFNVFDSKIVNLPIVSSFIGYLGGGGFFLIIMYEYLIGIFIYCYKDEILLIISNKYFLIIAWTAWTIFYEIYNFTDLIKNFGEMHNPVLGLTLPWLVIGFAYSFSLKFKYDISYGMYLYHMPIILAVIDLTNCNYRYILLAYFLIITLSFISCLFIDTPLIKIKNKLTVRLTLK